METMKTLLEQQGFKYFDEAGLFCDAQKERDRKQENTRGKQATQAKTVTKEGQDKPLCTECRIVISVPSGLSSYCLPCFQKNLKLSTVEACASTGLPSCVDCHAIILIPSCLKDYCMPCFEKNVSANKAAAAAAAGAGEEKRLEQKAEAVEDEGTGAAGANKWHLEEVRDCGKRKTQQGPGFM